jgi:hypothetical protein
LVVEFARGILGIDVDVQADTDEIYIADSLAQKARKFVTIMKKIVGPFKEYPIVAGDFGGGIAEGESGDQRQFLRRQPVVQGYRECDCQNARVRPPGIFSSPAASDLPAGQDGRRSKKPARAAQSSGMIAGASQSGKPVEAVGFEAGAEAGKIEWQFVILPIRPANRRRR